MLQFFISFHLFTALFLLLVEISLQFLRVLQLYVFRHILSKTLQFANNLASYGLKLDQNLQSRLCLFSAFFLALS